MVVSVVAAFISANAAVSARENALASLGNETRVRASNAEIGFIFAGLAVGAASQAPFFGVVEFAGLALDGRDRVRLADIVARFPEAFRAHADTELGVVNQVERADHTSVANQEGVALTSDLALHSAGVSLTIYAFASSVDWFFSDWASVAVALCVNKL